MKNVDNALKEYVSCLSDDDLRFLSSRYSQMLCGDRAEILVVLSRAKEIDKWLGSATGVVELFDMVDKIGELVMETYSAKFESNEVQHAN